MQSDAHMIHEIEGDTMQPTGNTDPLAASEGRCSDWRAAEGGGRRLGGRVCTCMRARITEYHCMLHCFVLSVCIGSP